VNRYLCYWKNKSADLQAETSYKAQLKAQKHFQKNERRKVQTYDIAVVLAEKNGEPVIHSTTEFG